MILFQRIVRRIQSWFKVKQATNFTLDRQTLLSLQSLAEQEQRTPEEIANQILGNAFRNHQVHRESWQRWQSLTSREQEIAALICLKYTSRQIAEKLHISPETIKTHVEHIFMKFGISDRDSLRQMLSSWDFKAWDR